MDNDGNKALWIFVAVIGFIVVASIYVFGINKGKTLAEQQLNKVDNLNNSLAISVYSGYDNTVVYGSDVISAIRLYANDVTVNVDSNTYNAKNRYDSTDEPIESTDKYKAELTIEHDSVTAINFKKQGEEIKK